MRLNSFSPLILSVALVLWPKIVTAATQSSSALSQSQSRHHDGHWASTNPRGRRRRQPSALDQLDNSSLGFITPSNVNGVTRFSRGGGSSDTITKPHRTTLPPIAFASTMSFLAAYSHVVCLSKFKSFSAMMSGTILASARALADGRWSDFKYGCSLFGSYFLGVIVVRSIELNCQRRAALTVDSTTAPVKSNNNAHLRIVGPIAAAIFAIADKLMSSSPDNRNYFAILVLGYSMVYTSANSALKPMTMTQLVTGHLTKVGNALTDRVLEGKKMWNAGTMTSACILVSFMGGGALGAKSLGWMPEEVPTFAMLGVVYAMVLAMF